MRTVHGIDAAFLHGETPQGQFHVAALEIVDPTGVADFGIEKIRDVYRRRVHRIPQFRWLLRDPTHGVDWPYFVDDPHFDLRRHVHAITVAPPGDRRALGRLVGDLVGRRLDRRRPLWEVWLIEGLEGGRAAVLTKVHHAIVDGVSGAAVAAILLDPEPDPPPDGDPPPFEPEREPPLTEVLAHTGASLLCAPGRVGRLGRQLIEQGLAALPLATATSGPALPFQAPRSPLNGSLTARRLFAYASLPLEEVMGVKVAAQVKLNDVVLAVCAGALRAYLIERDRLSRRPLVAQVPVSTRTADTAHAIGTSVGSMFVSLATDETHPDRRLRIIHENATQAKALRRAMAAKKSMHLSDALWPGLFGAAARLWTRSRLEELAPPVFNVIVSNVMGPPGDAYRAGAKVEAMYPIGPLLYGTGLNITAYSHGDRLDVGLQVCPDLVPDPWRVAGALLPSLRELSAAVSAAAVPPGARA